MSSFLELVVDDLHKRFNGDFEDVTLVFPSRRAGLFFNKYLSEKIQKPVWAPASLSIGEIMERLSGLKQADSISLISRLYLIYKNVKGVDEPFDSFYFWGEVILADFDQVDKYRVDAAKLYANVKDIKVIEEQFGGLTPEQAEIIRNYLGLIASTNESKLRDNFLTIWKVLGDIYSRFTSDLIENGLCYEGLAFRRAADALSANNSKIEIPNNIIFIGFNALNECEKLLFSFCKKHKNALFYWDYDKAFVDNPVHEAGTFIRENLVNFPNALPSELFTDSTVQSKKVNIIAAPSTVTQAKLIPTILDDIKRDGGLLNETTSIVFPRENLLITALQSIPQDVENLNITMGYPLKETPAFSITESLIKLQINKRILADQSVGFYYRDVLTILNHPYIRIVEPDNSAKLVGDIKRKNLFYPSHELVNVSPFLTTIFRIISSSNDLPAYILGIINAIAMSISNRENNDNQVNIDLEFLYALHKCLNRLGGVIDSFDFEISPKLFLQIFRKVFVQERVSFSGEPLAGLQLMGFLETRALDFENLVVLSFNDDIIPGRNFTISFITPSLRVAYGLPDFRHHNSVYAYYFYRLLHRAKRVYLVYSSRTEGLSSGEKSRFALQLEYEQMIGKVNTIPVNFHIELNPQTPIVVNKSDEVINSLVSNLHKEGLGIVLSPSGLTSYLTCPLRFYFRYGVGIHEPDEIAEEVGIQEFGSIIHAVMEQLYKPFEGQLVTAALIDGLLKNSEKLNQTVDSAFCKIFLNDESTKSLQNLSGRNLLARNAMLFTIKKMLRVDMQRAPFRMVTHEQKVYINVDIANNHKIAQVKLGGIVDRIESNADTLWIIDYKTGNPKDKGKFSDIAELFNQERVEKVKEVFQIFCYALAAQSIYENQRIKPGLWFVKALKPGEQPFVKVKVDSRNSKDVDDFQQYANEFRAGLQNLIATIFNTSIPFAQTDKTERCKTCPYAEICVRD